LTAAIHLTGANPESVVPSAKESTHNNAVIDNSMRLNNGDVSFNEVIERNGGQLTLANMDSLFAPF
jgi:hypothetical protein